MKLQTLLSAITVISLLAATILLLTFLNSTELDAQTPPPVVAITYQYDSLGRLVSGVYPSNTSSYNYDAAGNRVPGPTLRVARG